MRKGEERTSSAGMLIVTGLCCLLGLMGVAAAVGAVVPVVGDAMDVDNRGVGAMIGYLVGALVFGGIGLFGLAASRRRTRDRPRQAPLQDNLSVAPELLLPAGPGLTVRWLGAVPLMLVTTVLPMVGNLVISAWSRLSFRESLPDFGDPEPDPTFWSLVGDNFGNVRWILAIPAIALVGFLVWRTRFSAWPKVCLWLAVWALGPSVLIEAMVDGFSERLPNIALGLGLILLNHQLGVLTLWLLSRPVARDLALSELEIPYQVPGSRARLRVRRDELRLDRLRAEKGNVHKSIRWADLSAVTVEEVPEPKSWQASASTTIEVPAGSALRVLGEKDEWLLPVTETMGEDLAAAITLRVHNRP